MDYQNLEGIQSLKGVAHALGLRRTKSGGLHTRSQILPMATEQPVSGTDDPNHGAATSPSTSLLSGNTQFSPVKITSLWAVADRKVRLATIVI